VPATGVQSTRSTPVARLIMGDDDLRPPFLSEIQSQLQITQAILQLAHAVVLDLTMDREVRALARASGMVRGVESALEWAASEFEMLSRRPEAGRDPGRVFSFQANQIKTNLEADPSLPGSLLAVSVVGLAIEAAKEMKNLREAAEDEMKNLRKAAEEEIDKLEQESQSIGDDTRESPWVMELTIRGEAEKKAEGRYKEALRARSMAVAAIPEICAVDQVPVLRIRHESPVELIVALVGGAGALVAILQQLLDLEIKFKTRKERERAERAHLERKMAEDEEATRAVLELGETLSKQQSSELPIRSVTVYDTLDQALKDAE
jgi:hypothetical protein